MPFGSAVSITPVALTSKAAVSIATLVAADGTNGNKFVFNEKTLLRVKNASGSPITVTVHANFTYEGQAVTDDTFQVAATTGDVIYSGFSKVFAQSTGEVWIEFSAVTSVTAQVIQPA